MAFETNGHAMKDTHLTIGGQTFTSRLMLGTGKYRDSIEMNAAFEAAGSEIITVALRRIDFDDPKSRSVLEDVDWKKYTILPNTAGCQTAEEAIRIAREAGIARVQEVDCEDDKWEVEGRDAQGRKIEVEVHAGDGRVLVIDRRN